MNPSVPEFRPETGREEAGEPVVDITEKDHHCDSIDAGQYYIKCLDEDIYAIRRVLGNAPASRATESIDFCPWCGLRLGEIDEKSQAVVNTLESAARLEKALSQNARLKPFADLQGMFATGKIQITVLDRDIV